MTRQAAGSSPRPSRPELSSLPLFERLSQLYFDLIEGDVPATHSHAASLAAECRDAGMVGMLAYALVYLGATHALRGEFLDARATAEEGLRIAADTGPTSLTEALAAVAAELAAVTGDEEACRARAGQAREPSGGAQTFASAGANLALTLLDLGSARYQAALNRMQEGTNGPARHSPQLLYAYPDHVEAAIRAGRPDLAARPLAQFTAWAGAIGQPWAAAVAVRSCGWPQAARRTSRSARSCSCPRGPWAITCTRPFPSSASPPARNWRATRHNLTAGQNDRAGQVIVTEAAGRRCP